MPGQQVAQTTTDTKPLRVAIAGIPQYVSRGPQILLRPEWPVGAEYDEHGRLVRLLDKATFAPLPSYGPSEPIVRLLHRHAAERESGIRSQVYFIGPEAGPIKIGYSGSAAERLKSLQAGSPVRLRILATCPGAARREAAYHYEFAAHRLHGEWFEPHPDILAEIERLNERPTHEA